MTTAPLTLCLPIADRRTSCDFYRDVLGLEPFGIEDADDGVPEPLLFALNTGLTLMCIPSGGFGWVIGEGRSVARPDTSEHVVSISVDSEDEIRAHLDRARAAGGMVTTEPADKGWGMHGAFTDPDGHLWMLLLTPVPFKTA